VVVLRRWTVPLACWLGLLTGALPLVAAADGPEPAPPPASVSALECGDEMGRVCRVEPDAHLKHRGDRRRVKLVADQPDPERRACPDVDQPLWKNAESRQVSLEPVRLCDTFDTGGRGSRLEVKLIDDGLLVLGSNTVMRLQPAETHVDRPCSGAALAQLDLRQGAVLLHHRPGHLGAQVVDVVTPAALICLEGTDVFVAHDPGTGTTVVHVENGRGRMLRFKDRGVVRLETGAEETAEVPSERAPETGAPRFGQLLRDPSRLFFDSPLLDPFDLGAVGTTP
jgi:hypothetical protein